MRYIIEAGLLQAELLNRTLVIPSFVYARSCEYNMYAMPSLPGVSVLIPFSKAPFAQTMCLWLTEVMP